MMSKLLAVQQAEVYWHKMTSIKYHGSQILGIPETSFSRSKVEETKGESANPSSPRKLPCETLSEKKQQSETNVVINDKSQGDVATHLQVTKF